MIFLPLLMSLYLSHAQIAPLMFTSIKDQTVKVDVTKHKKGGALFIDENCGLCDKLIKKLHKKCSSFKTESFSVFATGEKKNLKKKVEGFVKKGVLVYTHPDVSKLSDLGLVSIPSYMNKKKEISVGVKKSFKALLKDKACIK